MPLPLLAMFPPRLAAEPKEGKAIPPGAGCRPYGRAQRPVQPAGALETLLADSDDHVLPLVAPHQERAGLRQPRILGRGNPGLARAGGVGFILQEALRGPDAQVGVVGDLQCPAAGPLRKAPSALACTRQAIRRNRNCLWFDRVSSPNTSRYLSLSWPTVRCRRPSIACRTAVVLIVVSSLMPLTSQSHERSVSRGKQGLCLIRLGSETEGNP